MRKVQAETLWRTGEAYNGREGLHVILAFLSNGDHFHAGVFNVDFPRYAEISSMFNFHNFNIRLEGQKGKLPLNMDNQVERT